MPSLRAPANFYAGNSFNRLAERRNDAQWLAGLSHDDMYLLPLWQGRNLVSNAHEPTLVLIQRTLLSVVPEQDLVLLGEFRSQYCFAVQVQEDTATLALEHGEFHELRAVGGQMDRDEAGLLGYARALLLWHDKHRYCGRCGTPTVSIQAGHALKCSNAQCGLTHFPRLDPAVIVLVTNGDRVLLGRQPQWPPERYSTIAGYVEWAESLEEAVVREVHEETGVRVDNVEYHSSQPWPFPSSLMLGFIAHAASTDIQRGDGELEDARWFSRAELARGAVILPPQQAIAHRLIETWYDREAERPLREEPGVRVAGLTQPATK